MREEDHKRIKLNIKREENNDVCFGSAAERERIARNDGALRGEWRCCRGRRRQDARTRRKSSSQKILRRLFETKQFGRRPYFVSILANDGL